MRFQVRLFARAQELAGTELAEIDLPELATVADLRTVLAERYPELSPLASNLLVALGTDYADDSDILKTDKEIACFPPVSGG